ncbi:YdbL family protein [Methyloprofundus sp.]|uniref:YdbL family protein n=1 Tax=Methyloprofundus sp. TaxID=2020875 RepID=UPI003D143D9B
MNIYKIPFVSALFLTACVTINIYFPAAAAEQVADEIIQDIQKTEPQANPSQSLVIPDSDISTWQLSVYRQLDQVISVFISSAHAQANLSVDSADIRRLTASMRSRFSELKPFYQQGAIGIKSDGLLTLKGKVPLKDRNKVNKLIASENADRIKLYQAIAKENGHPEWFAQIKTTFAARWVKNAQSGWWYQLSNGSWKQK